jgi:hypothetical protein
MELARHVGGPHHVTFESLWDSISREPLLQLEVEWLTKVREELRGLDPLPRLISCLLLLRWLGGSPPATSWLAAFARDAASAIYDLGRAELFPLRIFMLDGLLSIATHLADGAELLFLRGNTALMLSSWDGTWYEHAIRDLRAAAELGRIHGLTRTEVEAEGALARATLVRMMSRPPASLEELEQKAAALSSLLPRAEPIGLASDIHELLADLEALRAQGGQPEAGRRAIQYARQALESARSPRLKTARLATLAQLLLLHGTPEQAPEALRLARESVDSLPAEAGPLLAVAPLMALGLVLLRSNLAAEAAQHLEHALALQARQPASANRNLCRIHLAQAFLALARSSDAAHQLELGLRDAQAIGDDASVLDATRLLVKIDRKEGRDSLAEARLRQAEELLAGTAGQTLLALERLHPRRHGEEPSAELLRLLRDRLSGRVRSNAAADEFFLSVVANHATELPEDLRRQLLDKGARLVTHSSIRARLLAADGREAEAVGLLRDVLSHSTEPQERLQAAALLMVFLPQQAEEERLRCCDLVEELLEGPMDTAATRSDLAAALSMCSLNRPELIERALRHADRAAVQLEDDPGAHEVNTRIRAKLRFNQLLLGVLGSSATLAGLATWFEVRLSLPGPELAEFRCDAARCLLASGPLAHPEALSVAGRLLGLVPLEGDAPGLLARLSWIRARIASPEASAESLPPPALRGPFDEVPAWAISLVQGTRPQEGLTAPESRELEAVLVITRVRPDRAEAVLTWLAGLDAREEVLEAIASVAGSAPRASVQPFMELVERMAERSATFPLLHLRVLLYHHSLEWGEGTRYQRAADALLAAARTPEERIEALVQKGVERMNAFRAHPHEDEQGRALTRAARDAMTVALDEARRLRFERKELFSLLVFAGNSFRTGVDPDIARALALYEEAEALGAPSPSEEARLGRVMAETLLERGASGDARRALEWVERSLKVRKDGFLRVESLLTAARAEMLVSEGSEPVRLRRALERLDEADRIAEQHQRQGIASKQVIVLARLVRCSPGEAALKRRLEELARRHPEFADSVERALRGVEGPVPRDMMEDVGHALRHPALHCLYKAVGLLSPRDPKMVEEMGRRLNADPARIRMILKQYEEEDRLPRALREHADRFAQVQDPRERPGAAVGRARLLSHVAEHGLARAEEIRAAAEEAEQLARQVQDPKVRGWLLVELAPVWAPRDHARHPVRDFRRAAALAREVREGAAARGELARLALQILARATRYRTDGDIAAHWRDAEQFYEQCVAEYEAVGMLDVAANARSNLEELRTARRGGDHAASMRDGLVAARERVARASSPEQEARARLNLAVTLTIQGTQLPRERGLALLTEARTEFERIDRSLLSRSEKAEAGNYETICRAELAELKGQRQDAINLWRARLASLGPDVPDVEWAYTVHNLADMLIKSGSLLPQVMEGLDLLERALQVRTLENNPQHHWETCENIGRTVAGLLAAPPEGISWEAPFARELWARGRTALKSALEAARRIGSHDRIMQSASALLSLSRQAPSVTELEESAEEAWRAIDEARPYLLLEEKAGVVEAKLGAEVATTLAVRLANTGLVGVSDGSGFVLSGERAERVLRWMVRATGAAQRRLAGRMARPEGVPYPTWGAWLAAVRTGDARTIGRALDAIRQGSSSFLRGEPELEGTWRWLRERPGSAALAVMETSRGLLAALLEHDGKPRVLVAELEVPPPPCDEAAVSRSVTADGPGEEYRALQAWAETGIVTPLRRLLSRSPSQLLWIPTGALRMLAPGDLWPSVPVTCAARMDLETRPSPERPRSTFLAVADPGLGAQAPRGELPGAIQAGAQLARLLPEAMRPLRVRMSRGAVWGKALGISCPELVEGPASPEDVLREMADADVVVLLCHGEVDGPRQARLMLLDGSGTLVALDMEHVAADPKRVAGATVILLSCETGRVGDWLHQAAGLSGALLACGARNVVAPLWPVRMDPAIAVGETVLAALVAHEDVSVALRRLSTPEGGATLGRVDPRQLARERTWSVKAFVQWTG